MVQDSGYLLTFDGAWKNNRATEGTVKMQSATSTLTIKGSFDTKAAGEAAEAAEALRESAEAAEALLQLETRVPMGTRPRPPCIVSAKAVCQLRLLYVLSDWNRLRGRHGR